MPQVTWLTPFFDIWKKEYGGALPGGQAAKALKPVVDELGAAEAAVRFERYCRTTPAQYASPSRFASTHGQYAADAVDNQPVQPRPLTMGRVI